MVLLLRKLYLYLTKDPLFSGGGGGGVQLFPGGGGGGQNANFYRNYIHTCYFPGGVSGPPIPLWICTWAMSS